MIRNTTTGKNETIRKVGGWVPFTKATRPAQRKWIATRQTNPAARSMQKARFALVAGFWEATSAAQKVAWGSAVSAYKAKVPALQKMPDYGFTLFMYVNINRLNAANSLVFDPPTPVDVPALSISDLSVEPTDKIKITGTVSGNLSNWLLSISLEPPSSAGLMAAPNEGTRVYLDRATASFDITLTSSIYFPFGSYKVGSKLFAMTNLINSVTGQQSALQTNSAISGFGPGNYIQQVGVSAFFPITSSPFTILSSWIGNFNLAPTALTGHLAIQISTTPSIVPDFSSATEIFGFTAIGTASQVDNWYKAIGTPAGQPTPKVGNAVAVFAWATNINNGLGDTNRLVAVTKIFDQADITP